MPILVEFLVSSKAMFFDSHHVALFCDNEPLYEYYGTISQNQEQNNDY